MTRPSDAAGPQTTEAGSGERGVLVLLRDESLVELAGYYIQLLLDGRSPSMCRERLLNLASEAEARYGARADESHQPNGW
jgi:hypothetical protein